MHKRVAGVPGGFADMVGNVYSNPWMAGMWLYVFRRRLYSCLTSLSRARRKTLVSLWIGRWGQRACWPGAAYLLWKETQGHKVTGKQVDVGGLQVSGRLAFLGATGVLDGVGSPGTQHPWSLSLPTTLLGGAQGKGTD